MSNLSPERWKELSPYLDEALSRSGQDRAEWLARFREINSELAAAVETLLQEQHAVAQEGFLANSPPLPSLPSASAGDTIGAYKLLAPIGYGGMGTVWLAERSDGRFDRKVAIKFPNFALPNQSGVQRFKREGSILGRLAHRNIAELVDAGVSANGQSYLILEYVDGAPINQYCNEHGLDVKARIRLFLDVLSAVAHAHTSLIVHRDIKPSNVLVRHDGQVKLLDFGIAKLLEEHGHDREATVLTREGGPALTPEYASPEQITGALVTTATDVYSLGVLLYVILGGQHPAGPGPRSAADLVKAIVDTEPPPLSEIAFFTSNNSAPVFGFRQPTIFQRHFRRDLDTIVAKALKKLPQERYSSVAAFADDLERYLRNDPIKARPDTLRYRTGKFVRRNWVAVTLSALAIIAIIAGLVGTVSQAKTVRRQRDFAFRQLDRAEVLNEFNEFILSDASPGGKTFTVRDLLDHAADILARQQSASNNRVELMAFIGSQYSLMEYNLEARNILEKAYKLSRGLSDPTVRAEAACFLASALAENDVLERAEALFQEGMRDLPQEPQFAMQRVDCLRRGSEVAQERGDAREGVLRMEAARQVLRDSPYDSDWSEIGLLTDLGEAYRTASQNYKASSIFENVNSLLTSMGRDKTRSAGVLYNNWGLALEKLGKPREAASLFRQAIDIQGGGREEMAPPIVLNNYAITLLTLGHLKEAADYSGRAYQKVQETRDPFTIYRSLNVLTSICIDNHDYKCASVKLAQLETVLQEQFSPDNMWFGILRSQQALLALGTGDSQQASKLADDAVTILECSIKLRGQGAEILPTVLLRRATIELAAAHPVQAKADATRALVQYQAACPPGAFSRHIGNAYLELGNALRALGKPHEARTAFLSAAEHFDKTLGSDHADTLAARKLASLSE